MPLSFTLHIILDDVLAIPLIPALSTSFAFHGSPFLLIGLDNLLPGGKSKYPPSFNAHFNGRLMSSLMSLLRSSMILTWVLLVYAIITPTSC
ncbi:hypothetical protein F4604DRAFT_1939077 [Suillus subluteus]|nr:hypothetical protein F4604DRAFT_1939077 [Suillus subluteus]